MSCNRKKIKSYAALVEPIGIKIFAVVECTETQLDILEFRP